jgi:hypothetical protein
LAIERRIDYLAAKRAGRNVEEWQFGVGLNYYRPEAVLDYQHRKNKPK